MAKSVLDRKTRERYTGLDYSSLISMEGDVDGEKPVERKETQPETHRLAPRETEKRTRRVQLVLKPSLYVLAEAKAKELGFRSFNDYVCTLLEGELENTNAGGE